MTNQPLTYYIERYTDGTISREELLELAALLRDPVHLETFRENMRESWDNWEQHEFNFEEVAGRIERTLLNRIANRETGPGKVFPGMLRMRRWWVAASVAAMMGIGFYLLSGDKNDPISGVNKEASIISPGNQGAILTLADGKEVVLDSLTDGVIASQYGTLVRLEDNLLRYDQEGTDTMQSSYHTMRTPNGRQFRLMLPDGTRVWLNAASSIRYPTRFTGRERQVEITGEAFLEVAKTSPSNLLPPFVVQAGIQTIHVLGTSFNISAYEDEQVVKTTLLEGRVRIDTRLLSGAPVTQQLSPGQQFVTTENDKPLLRTVIPEEVTAWKNGYFVFENADVNEVLLQIARWYDVRVENSGSISGFAFSGKIPRSSSLEELLKMLRAGGLEVSLNGRTIIVTNKN
jgi:transmembrane sensor